MSTAQRARLPSPSLAVWVALCAAAEAIGMSAASAAAVGSRRWVADPASPAGQGLILAMVISGGLIEGVALGAAQAAGLARSFAAINRRRWVLVTVAVAGLGWAMASLPSTLAADEGGSGPAGWLVTLGAAGLGAGMGLLLGGAQMLVLRRVVPHPARWVGANALGWAAAMPVIFWGAGAPGPGWSLLQVIALGAVTGAAAGSVLGLVTGWFLPSLAGPSPHNRILMSMMRSPLHVLLDHSMVVLRVRGVHTGSPHELPVMYAVGPNGLIVYPGRPAGKRWWRNLRHPAPVALLHQGRWQVAVGELLQPGDRGYDSAADSYQRRWRRTVIGPGDPLVRIQVIEPASPVPDSYGPFGSGGPSRPSVG